MKRITVIVLLSVCFPVLSFSDEEIRISEQDEPGLLASFSEKLGGIRDFSVEFIQEREIALFQDTLISRGYCYFSSPDKLRWEFTQPYRSILIYNKGKTSRFDTVDGRLRKLEQGQNELIGTVLGEILFWMRGDFSRSKDTYDLNIFKSPAGKTYRVRLVPLSVEFLKVIREIDLVFDGKTYMVVRVVLTDGNGDRIVISFDNQKNNQGLNPGLFDINNPASGF